MGRIIISAFVLVAAMISCQKTTAPQQHASKALKMTLTATICNGDTKVSYEDVDNVLKTAWEQYNKVSLLALDSQGRLLSNDIFTAMSAGKSVDFDGVFTNDPNTASLVVYYPALTQGTGEESSPYESPTENGYSGNGVLYGAKKGDKYLTIRSAYFLQTDNANTSHLAQYALMAGPAEVQGDKISVTMEHLAYVIKTVYTLPDEGCRVKSSSVQAFTSSDANAQLTFPGWREIANYDQQNSAHYIDMNFGSEISGGSGNGFVVEGNTLTVYYVGYGNVQLKKDSYLSFHLDAYKEDNYMDLNAKKNFDSDKTLEPGKMYRLSATLEAAD